MARSVFVASFVVISLVVFSGVLDHVYADPPYCENCGGGGSGCLNPHFVGPACFCQGALAGFVYCSNNPFGPCDVAGQCGTALRIDPDLTPVVLAANDVCLELLVKSVGRLQVPSQQNSALETQ
jgi:hypothetical protein